MKFNKLYLAMAAAALAACTNPVEPYDAIYMTDAQISQDKSITIDITPDGTAITVSSSVNATEDIQVELGVDAALLEGYNKKYEKNYLPAPESSYSLSSNTTVIKAGHNMSEAVDLTVNSTEEFKEGSTYCIPVTIRSTSAMKVLEASRTLFVVLKTPVISKAIYLGSNIYRVDSSKQESSLAALPQVTMEARVYVESFASWDPYISSIMGIEGVFGVRFGDVKVSPNAVQICHDSYQPAAESHKFDTNKWYHVAAVWSGSTFDIYIDGQYATGVPVGGETINLTSDNSGGFYIGASYGGGRPLYGYVAEVRVWTRALSQSEIANNMNYVDPQSEGLLAYWRMNAYEPREGGGNIVKDETGHGHDAVGGANTPKMMDTKWL